MDLTLLKNLDSLIHRYWNSDFKEHVNSLGIDIDESEEILSFLKRLNSEERYVELQTIGRSLLKDAALQFDEVANNQLGARLIKDWVYDLKTLFENENYPLDDEIRRDTTFPLDLKLHPKIISACESLYRDRHYSQAIFESVKILEKEIKNKSGIRNKSGVTLVNHVFHKENPLIKIVDGNESWQVDERDGFRFLFMGAFSGIKNPKSHDTPKLTDSAKALEYIAFISLLMKRLDESIIVR